MPFSIVSLDAGVTRIALEGDLDVFTVEQLRSELADVVRRRPRVVEVELSRLRTVSPRGMDILVAFFTSVARTDCRITVRGMRDQPLKCFKAALVDAILNASRPAN